MFTQCVWWCVPVRSSAGLHREADGFVLHRAVLDSDIYQRFPFTAVLINSHKKFACGAQQPLRLLIANLFADVHQMSIPEVKARPRV